MGCLAPYPFGFWLINHRAVLIGMGAGIVHKQVSKMDFVVQKVFYGCTGPNLRVLSFAGFVQAVPVPARREDAVLIESGAILP